jgi:hypothetical protein
VGRALPASLIAAQATSGVLNTRSRLTGTHGVRTARVSIGAGGATARCHDYHLVIAVRSLLAWIAYLIFCRSVVKITKKAESLTHVAKATEAFQGGTLAALAQALGKTSSLRAGDHLISADTIAMRRAH